MKKFCSVLLIICMLALPACTGETQTDPPVIDWSDITIPDTTEPETTVPDTTEPDATTPETPPTEPESEVPSVTGGLDPEFKAMMDAYEAFFKDYCEFMKKYMENPYNPSLLVDYAEYITKYADTMAKLDGIENEDLSTEDLKYYLEVYGRITEMLLDIL